MERCAACSRETHRLISAGRCHECHTDYYLAKCRAHAAVRRAIRDGLLPRAEQLPCVDCGGASREYDHRDYLQPLKVEPVCHGCNLRRGSGFWPSPYAFIPHPA
jgi:hypothetical protein